MSGRVKHMLDRAKLVPYRVRLVTDMTRLVLDRVIPVFLWGPFCPIIILRVEC